MQTRLPTFRSHLTLVLSAVLHAFTHAYASMLVPLYLVMVTDLKLGGVRSASLIVTLYGAVYCLGSYTAGALSDRFDRKVLLSIGLLGNAASIVAIGLCRNYPMIVMLGIAAGAFGTLFHPAANALAPAHYPKSPAMAIGLLGAGSGVGFFFGPQYAGWRTHTAAWHWASVAQWQKPCVELGVMGLVVGVIFLFVGAEANDSASRHVPDKINRVQRVRVIQSALILMFRDFCGAAIFSLAAIYLQRAFHVGVQRTGLMVGIMVLPSVLFNPLFVYLTSGRRRMGGLSLILFLAAVVAAVTPLVGGGWVLAILCVYQTLQMGSFAVGDVAMLERVAPEVRGRVVGLFMVIAGTFGALGPWVMGAWTDLLGPRGGEPSGYFGPFGLISAFMLLAAVAPPWLAKLGPVSETMKLVEEISPATMGATP